MRFFIANKNDTKEIYCLQKDAFYQQGVFYNNFNLTPLVEKAEDFIENFKNFTFLKAIMNDKIIGSVRAYAKNGTCFISRLIVHPEYQKKGIGSKLMVEIEMHFKKSVNRFELFTGKLSSSSISLYKNLGYNVYKTSDDYDVPIAFMQKTVCKDEYTP